MDVPAGGEINVTVNLFGQVVTPGDRLLLTFTENIPMDLADRLRRRLRAELGVEAVLVRGVNQLVVLPPAWTSPPAPEPPADTSWLEFERG